MTINSEVFTISVTSDDPSKVKRLLRQHPVRIEFHLLTTRERSSPRCVFWKHPSLNDIEGHWSSEGCQLLSRRLVGEVGVVTCECSHMTSFAVLMDISDIEYLAIGSVSLSVLTYVFLSFSLVFLCVCLVSLCAANRFRRASNSASIHVNIVCCLLVATATFVSGVDNVQSELSCKMVSIFLHFFGLAVFFWLFVDTLHLYRMIVEPCDINSNSMRFYYVLGYVLPAILVSLTVGLDTEGYGNIRFCWLSSSGLIFWSFIGPILLIIISSSIVFTLATRAILGLKSKKEPSSNLDQLIKGVKISVTVLPLVCLVWMFALLAVAKNSAAFQYLFAIVSAMQAAFLVVCYVFCDKMIFNEVKRTIYKLQGKNEYLQSTQSPTRNSMLSRSVLSYNNDSSMEGGLPRPIQTGIQYDDIEISTSSTASVSQNISRRYSARLHPNAMNMSSLYSEIHAHPVPRQAREEIQLNDYSLPRRDSLLSDEEDDYRDLYSMIGSGVQGERSRHDLASSHSSDGGDDDDDVGDWSNVPTPQKVIHCHTPVHLSNSSVYNRSQYSLPTNYQRSHHSQRTASNSSKKFISPKKSILKPGSFRIDDMVGSPSLRRQSFKHETVPVLTHNGGSATESDVIV